MDWWLDWLYVFDYFLNNFTNPVATENEWSWHKTNEQTKKNKTTNKAAIMLQISCG